MKFNDVVKLIDAGFDTKELLVLDQVGVTDDLLIMVNAGLDAKQIKTFDTDGLFTYASEPEPKKEHEPEPVKADLTMPDYSDTIKSAITKGFEDLAKALQTDAVNKSFMPPVQKDDDILAQIIAPSYNKRGE